jgi:hypothetical protein
LGLQGAVFFLRLSAFEALLIKIQLDAGVVVVMLGVAFVALLVTLNPAGKVPWPDGSTTVTNLLLCWPFLSQRIFLY